MGEIINIENTESGLTVDSREVAEMVERNHSDVMRDIRRIIEHLGGQSKIAQSYFVETSYVNTQNKSQPSYLLTKKGCELYATRMTGAKGTLFAVKYIERFNEMENQLKSQVALHSYMIEDPIKRAEKWIEEYKEKVVLIETIEEQKPLVAFAEKCIKTNDSILVRELAKLITEQGIINIGEKRLYQKLREWGLILRGKTEPSQSAMDKGYFEVNQRTINTPYGSKLIPTTKVLPKGQVYIVERLNKEHNKK